MSAIDPAEGFEQILTSRARLISASTTFQLATVPWPSPYRMRGRIKRIVASNFNGTAASIKIWDQDTNSSTPPTRGSASAALIEIGIAASTASGVSASNTVLDQNSLPQEVFDSGLAIQSSQINVTVHADIGYF